MKYTVDVLFLVALICTCTANTINVGPTRTYKDPAQAIGALQAYGTMILDDGTYATTFDIPNTLINFTIKSASGNPYKCVLNGQGGVGAGHRLSNGKGVIHAQAPGLILGIGFIGGGGADNVGDGEAGLYAETFAASGTLRVQNCSFDNNENGIFVPSALSGGPGQYVHLEVVNSIFSKNSPNGITSDGLSHNVYITGASFLSQQNIWYPSEYGNNLKSRALITTVQDQYNIQSQGRCLDIPSGGKLTVSGGTYTTVLSGSVSNFIEYAGENSNSGIYTPSISGLHICGVRSNEAIWNAASGVTMNFQNTVQTWNNSGASFNLIGTVTGIITSPPAGTKYVPIPTPTLPNWAK